MTARYELSDGLATITLDRPDKMNALTVEMREALADHFEERRATATYARYYRQPQARHFVQVAM